MIRFLFSLRPANIIDRLDAWSRRATWHTLAVSCLALVAFDHVFPEVGTGPLYIPLIALAGWRLGSREAWSVALAAAALNILPLHGLDGGLSPPRGSGPGHGSLRSLRVHDAYRVRPAPHLRP